MPFLRIPTDEVVKHGIWYLEHRMRVGDGPEPPVDSYLQVRDNTALLKEMNVVLSAEESLQHWESWKHSASVPSPDGPPSVPSPDGYPPAVALCGTSWLPVSEVLSFLPSRLLPLR